VDPLHPSAVKQLTPHLHVLVVLDRPHHEPDSRLRRAGEQQAPVADHAVAEEARRSVQEHDIEPLARNDAPEAREQTGQFGAPVVGSGLRNEDGHVNVALCPGASARPRTEQVSKLNLRERGKHLAELQNQVVLATQLHAR